MTTFLHTHLAEFLLAFGALISIVNPLSAAFIFYGATRDFDSRSRKLLARWVAIYSFCIVTFSLYIGAYILSFFGITLPVLRVAGGIIISLSGWQMLTAPDANDQKLSESTDTAMLAAKTSRIAFYPLTMPLTTGPGTISVAISLGAGRPTGFHAELLEFFASTMAAVVLLALLIYLSYKNAARIAGFIGPTGTTIIVRLSAFLLFCIGIQVLWNGAAELLGTLLERALAGHVLS